MDDYNVLSGTILHEMLHIGGNGESKFLAELSDPLKAYSLAPSTVFDETATLPNGTQVSAYGYEAAVYLALGPNGGAMAFTYSDTLTLVAIGMMPVIFELHLMSSVAASFPICTSCRSPLIRHIF